MAAAWWLLSARRCGGARGRVSGGLPVDAGGPWAANPIESLAPGLDLRSPAVALSTTVRIPGLVPADHGAAALESPAQPLGVALVDVRPTDQYFGDRLRPRDRHSRGSTPCHPGPGGRHRPLARDGETGDQAQRGRGAGGAGRASSGGRGWPSFLRVGLRQGPGRQLARVLALPRRPPERDLLTHARRWH